MYNIDDIPKTFRQQQRQRERWAIYSLPWWTISPGLRFWCERQECARISHCSENKALYFTQLGLGWHGTVFQASLCLIVKCALIWWPQAPCMKSPGFQPQVTPPPGEVRGWSPGPGRGSSLVSQGFRLWGWKLCSAGLRTGCSSLQPQDLPSLLLGWIPSSELFCLPQALSAGLLLNNMPREMLSNSVDHHFCDITTTTFSRFLRNTNNSRHTCVLCPAFLRTGSHTGLYTNSWREQELFPLRAALLLHGLCSQGEGDMGSWACLQSWWFQALCSQVSFNPESKHHYHSYFTDEDIKA